MKKITTEELNRWHNQYPSIAIRRNIVGDVELANLYMGEANKLLYELKNIMRLANLTQWQMKRVSDDGAIIIAKSVFGYDTIIVDVRRVVTERLLPNMLVFFLGEDDEIKAALVDLKNLGKVSVHVRSATWFVSEESRKTSFRTFQSKYSYILPSGNITNLIQLSGDVAGEGYISDGITLGVSYCRHHIYDIKTSKRIFIGESFNPWGPVLINSNNIFCNYLVYDHNELRSYIYDGSTLTMKDRWPYWEMPGYNPRYGFYVWIPQDDSPWVISPDLYLYYSKPTFGVIGMLNLFGYTIGDYIDVYFYIDGVPHGIHYNFVSSSPEDVATGLAAAINAIQPGLATAVGRFIFISRIDADGIDMGIGYAISAPEQIARWTRKPFKINVHRTPTFRKSGYKLRVERDLAIGDHFSFAEATAYTWDEAIPKEALNDYPSPHVGGGTACSVCGKLSGYHYPAFSQRMTTAQTKENVAAHIAGDLYSPPDRTADVIENIITIHRPTEYGELPAQYGGITDAFWNGPIGLVDYDCHYIPLNLYGRKIRKGKLTSVGTGLGVPIVGEDVETDTFSNLVSGTFSTVEYWGYGPTPLYELVYQSPDLLTSSSYIQEMNQVTRMPSLYADPTTGILSYMSYTRNLAASRDFDVSVSSVGTETTQTLSDEMTGGDSVEGIFERNASWEVNSTEQWESPASPDPQTLDVDCTWQVDDDGGRIHFINFPFSTITNKPFYYVEHGSDSNNSEDIEGESSDVNVNMHLDFKTVDGVYDHNTCTGTLDSNLSNSQITLTTPYETITLDAGWTDPKGWIHIQDKFNEILVQGIKFRTPGFTSKGRICENFILYYNGIRIESILAKTLKTTTDKLMGMIYIPGIVNDPQYQKFL